MKKLLSAVFASMAILIPGNAHARAIAYRADVPERYRALYEHKMQGKKSIFSTEGLLSLRQAAEAAKSRRAASRADETCTVTVNLAYDKSKEEQPFLFATGFDASVEFPDILEMAFFDEEAGNYAFDVKPGTYNLVIQAESPRGWIFLVKENVAVSGDMTLNFDTRQATNHITFKTLNKEGEEIKDDLLDPATDYTTVLDPGNIADATWNLDLEAIYNGHGMGSMMINSFRQLNEDGTVSSTSQNEWTVWVNDNSCMSFGRVDTYGDSSGMGYVRHYAPDSKTREVVNDPADYVTVTEHITPTPHVQATDPDNPYWFRIGDCANHSFYTITQNGIPTGHVFNGLTSSGEIGVRNDVMNICARSNGAFDIWCAVSITQDDDGTLEGAKVRVNADRSVTRIATAANEYPWDTLRDTEGRFTGTIDPQFAYDHQPLIPYGSSAPVTVVYPVPWSKENYQFKYYFTGLLGEMREIDRLTAGVTMKIDGRQILDSAQGIMDLFNSFWDTPLKQGKIELDITNTNHRTPEGLPGLNTVHMEYDTRLDDYEAPTLRALVIRDPAGMVQQSFETADDAAMGFIELCANDLTMNSHGWYAFANPAPQVKVEYAPYGKDNFSEITVSERPELFNAPGFGRHFTGSLPAVTEGAPYGWYDLRVTLTDAAGNFQQQLVRAAFQVREMASVENIASDSAPAVKAIYNMQGMRVDHPEAGNVYIELMTDGSSRKTVR